MPPVAALATLADRAFTPEDILRDGRPLAAGSVLIYDTENFFMGSALAERLHRAGHPTIVTPNDVVSAQLDVTTEGPEIRQRLRDCGVDLVGVTVIDRIELGRHTVAVPGPVQTRLRQAGPHDQARRR